jgi:hypothetical protein
MNKYDMLKYVYFNSKIIKHKYKSFTNFIKDSNLINQIGGNKLKVDYSLSRGVYTHLCYKIDDNENTYIFEKDDYSDLYILSSFDKYTKHCIVVSVDKTNRIANINELNGTTDNCLKSTNIKNSGSHLLKITLKMIEKYKDKLNINVITLFDTSFKFCGKHSLDLIYLSVLTSGETWYGKYGFRPVIEISNNNGNNINIKINNQLNNIYEKNKKIMDQLTITDINFIKYFIGTKLENTIKKVIQEFPKMLIKDVVKRLLSQWDKTCDIFANIYINLFHDCGLSASGTFYGKFI